MRRIGEEDCETLDRLVPSFLVWLQYINMVIKISRDNIPVDARYFPRGGTSVEVDAAAMVQDEDF